MHTLMMDSNDGFPFDWNNFPDLTPEQILELPTLPTYEMKSQDCLRCQKTYDSIHRVARFGLKRIHFLCQDCKRKPVALNIYSIRFSKF